MARHSHGDVVHELRYTCDDIRLHFLQDLRAPAQLFVVVWTFKHRWDGCKPSQYAISYYVVEVDSVVSYPVPGLSRGGHGIHMVKAAKDACLCITRHLSVSPLHTRVSKYVHSNVIEFERGIDDINQAECELIENTSPQIDRLDVEEEESVSWI